MRRRLLSLLAAGVTAAAIACDDIITDPSQVAQVEVRQVYPSVVSGDSLRDSLGVATPLTVLAFNYRGEPMPDAPVTFTALDTILEIGASTGGVRARGQAGSTGRVSANAGGLQVLDTIRVTSRPDSVAGGVVADTVLTLAGNPIPYYPPSDELTVRVLNLVGTVGIPVDAWMVSFQLQFHGRLLAPTDTAAAYLVATPTSTVPTWVDTTTAGTAGRRVRIRSDSLAPAGDSVIVFATVRHRGQQIRGSPFRLIVRTLPSGR